MPPENRRVEALDVHCDANGRARAKAGTAAKEEE